MYEYNFIKINLKHTAFKGMKVSEDYHEIIDQQSRDGWRLVQIFAPPIRGYGYADYYELIFEREVKI